jgi:fumarylacetoacetate (FAA) hydrolase
MKLVTCLKEGHDRLAMVIDGMLYEMDAIHPELPASMAMFLNYWDDYFPVAQNAELRIKNGLKGNVFGTAWEDSIILAPVPYPTSCRDVYAPGLEHSAILSLPETEVVKQTDRHPLFYFINHNSIMGPGDIACMPDHFEKLDFALTAVVVICKAGKNIKAAEADEYVGGLMIMNTLCAGTQQMEKMVPYTNTANGKDFATITGPMLVTTDELEPYEIAVKENHTGKCRSLGITCKVNGTAVSKGNLSDMHWTFAEIIERCSYGVQLFAGDIIGGGTVTNGSFLQLNNTGKLNDPDFKEQWLQQGDVIEMEIEGLGKLISTIEKEDSDYSMLYLAQ